MGYGRRKAKILKKEANLFFLIALQLHESGMDASIGLVLAADVAYLLGSSLASELDQSVSGG